MQLPAEKLIGRTKNEWKIRARRGGGKDLITIPLKAQDTGKYQQKDEYINQQWTHQSRGNTPAEANWTDPKNKSKNYHLPV